MRTIILLFTSLLFLTACTASPDLPSQSSTEPSKPADPIMSPPGTAPETEYPNILSGGGSVVTPVPIQIEEPIGTLEPVVPAEPFDPSPGDVNMARSSAFIDSIELLILESYPVQINLQLTGGLSTPCHQLRVAVDPPDKENRIYIDVYSVVDADKICVQVIEPFATTVSLGTFPIGHYSVYVNNELIGEFDS